MKYSFTLFKNIFDNKTHRQMHFDSFDEFENLLYQLSKEPGYKPKKGEYIKASSPLITPALFKEGTTRKNDNVIEWAGFACLDIDSYEGSFEDTVNTFHSNRFVCYSTSSSTQEHPRFRIILPLTSSVQSDKIPHFWFALNNKFLACDPQTKDKSRMFYIPAIYPDAYNFIFSHKDSLTLNPHELMSQYPYSDGVKKSNFSDAVQEKLVAYKKEKLTNTSYKWTSYRDCIFVNKTLIDNYRNISETGWYGQIFRILCSIASSAMKRGYPITPHEVSTLVKELDSETGNWYKNRPIELEAERAINFVMKSL